VAPAYLLGAIPFGLLFTRWLAHKDVRQTGSGNIGATNALRAGGKLVGALSLLADVLKGVIPVAAGRFIFDAGELLTALIAAAAFLGHLFPVYLGFKGGKGVATLFGVVLPWQPLAAVLAFLLWLAVLGISRYVSIASISVGASLPILAWMLGASRFCLITLAMLGLLMLVKHKDNLMRLADGREPRIGGA